MLVYVGIFLLTFAGGVLSGQKPPCDDSEPQCPDNEHYTYNNTRCIRTCANKWVPISDDCKSFTGCVCDRDFVRLYDDASGPCIPQHKCRCNDPKAVFSYCPTSCEPTCDNPYPEICTLQCLKPGCVCRKGFFLNKKTGKCVILKDCPDNYGCKGDMNATYKECANFCPPTCDDQNPTGPCPKICKLGCECNPGYVFTVKGEDGKCVLPIDCPDDGGCKGDMNATYSDCASPCPTTCANRHTKGEVICPTVCVQGCMCNTGYILNDEGICIQPEDCPDEGCGGDSNAEYSTCPSTCPATCENRDPDQPCTKDCGEPGCVCKQGFLKFDGKCIQPEACPDDGGCKGDMNATYSDCASPCPTTCANRHTKGEVMCPTVCVQGCMCNTGYILNDEGICILPEDCPDEGCGGDSNAEYSTCPSTCPATCENPDPDQCTKDCGEPGCVCKQGFLKFDGKCIQPEACPEGWPTCKENETYVNCKVECPSNYCPVDDSLYEVVCDPMYPCPGGCACKGGYLIASEDDKRCILSCDCPPVECTRPNEYWDPCAPGCLSERCDDRHIPCDFPYPGRPRCRCIEGYYRNESDICVPESECPKPKCGYNEVAVPCRQICPPQNCDIVYTDYACNEESKICRPGCDCLPDHLRNGSGICIPNDQCPPPPEPEPICGYNEVAVPCRQICPPQNCEIAYTEYACTEEHKKCEPGCNCLPDHLRNGSGICIPNDECPYPSTPVCGINEIARDCRRICPPQTCLSKYALFLCIEDIPCEPGCDCVANYLRDDRGICIPSAKCSEPCQVPDECKRTCEKPNPPNCDYNPPEHNMDGCDCKEGYILSYIGGECIPIGECPPDLPCNGDPNARPKRCPKPCPSTCQAPEQRDCKMMCQPIACECIDGHILSNNTESGRCILPDNCPGGNPCGKDGHFVDCKSECSRDYCPIDDSRDQSCDPPEDNDDCLSGCLCNINHKKKSREDPTCIESSTCPPVNCTRPNEEWCSCPSACLAENCEDINNQPTECNPLVLNCEPRCICKKDHFRNASGICVPAEECPCQVPDECKRTCEKPNPPNCDYNPPEHNMDGCDCKEGYILSYIGGKCIPIGECPPDLSCNGDPNARPKRCPKPCPSTCQAPEQIPCKKMCQLIGCECKDGHILSNNTESGRCILPDNCPGGNPCGKDGHFVDCKSECPREYCPIDDSRDQSCDPPEDNDNCLSGCLCNINHKKKSREDPTCIESSTCPPVNCTRPNEEWCSCPSACLAENCEDVNNQPTVCNTLVLNCEPRCICKKDHFRNASGICVPAEECPPVCKDPNAVYKECTSSCEPTCANHEPKNCTEECRPAGCVCKEGHVLDEDTGICVPLCQCPEPICKDPNAVCKECTSACEPTCANPRPEICTLECRPARCVCKEGYVLNEDTGICVLSCECPEAVCKDPNAVCKECTSACEPTCANPKPEICTDECRPAGCVCKETYVLNEDTGICVLPNECPDY